MANVYLIIALERLNLLKIIKSTRIFTWVISDSLFSPSLTLVLCFSLVLGITGWIRPIQIPISQEVVRQQASGRLRTVVIDPGHGGKDPGCRGKFAREAQVVLKIALELGRRIKAEQPHVKVIYTRMSDEFIELGERSAIANRNKADLFISIHCNAIPASRRIYGTETYIMGLHKTEGNLDVAKRENAVILKEDNYKERYKGFDPDSPLAHIMLANYQHAFMASSIKFAQHVEKSFHKQSDRTSRGVKQAGFLVLWRTTMPSVLIETGFLTNPEEERYLASEEGQAEVANAIYQAFREYKEEVDTVE